MLDVLKVILLGIVEGITEWLPVSSTGHLILVGNVLKPGLSDAFMEMFNVVIQLGAIMAVVVLYFHKLNPFSPKKTQKQKLLTWQMWIGAFQMLALIPGTSRSGATIVGALIIGVSREVAAEFTFFLAIPVMFGASALKLIKFGFHFTAAEFGFLMLGCVVSFGMSVIAIKFLMNYIKKNDFKVFGYYRIILGALIILVALFKMLLG